MRVRGVLLATTLLLAACGSDDESDDEPAAEVEESADDAATEETTADDAGDADDQAGDEAGGEPSERAEQPPADEDPPADEAPAVEEDPPADEQPPADESDTIRIESLDDIPQRCVDILADFLRDIEPDVTDVDWETATMGEVTEILDEFERRGDEFDTRLDEEGCGDLEFADDDTGFDELIEVARSEAPGTVAFLEFIDELSSGLDPGASDTPDAASPTTCDEVFDRFDELVGDAESIDDLPVSVLTEISTLSLDATSLCTIEELDTLFDRYSDVLG